MKSAPENLIFGATVQRFGKILLSLMKTSSLSGLAAATLCLADLHGRDQLSTSAAGSAMGKGACAPPLQPKQLLAG